MTGPERTLIPLGFSEIEALVYCELLRFSPVTGYAVAKTLGRGTANVYQAIAALVQKGAVMVADETVRTFRPVPPEELLAVLSGQFSHKKEEASTRLAEIANVRGDDAVYQLKTLAQTLERARHLISSADRMLLFDLPTKALAALKTDIYAAANRGVLVLGLVDCPELDQPNWIGRGSEALASIMATSEQAIVLVRDVCEHIVGVVSVGNAELLAGMWSENTYLSRVQHGALISRLKFSVPDNGAPASLLELFEQPIRNGGVPQTEGVNKPVTDKSTDSKSVLQSINL